MAYTQLTVEQANRLVSVHLPDLQAESIPAYGLIVTTGPNDEDLANKTVLVFRKTSGEILFIDTGEIPAQFNQNYPAPVTFWQELARRTGEALDPGNLDKLLTKVETGLSAILIVGLAIAAVWLYSQVKK